MSYAFSRTITIDHTKCDSSSSTDFPVLVSINHSTFKTVGNGGHIQNSNGYDIGFFSDSAGSSPLSWEVEFYDGTNGILVAWVKIPSVSSLIDTVFYVFYDDPTISSFQSSPTAVWDTNYKGVWHFPDGTSLGALDSTSSGRNGTISGASAVAGQIDGGVAVTSGNTINASPTGLPSGSSVFTLSGWLKTNNASSTMIFLNYGDAGGVNTQAYLGVYDIADGHAHEGIFGVGNANVGTLVNINDNAWHYIVGTFDGTTIRIYLDGVVSANTHSASPNITLTACHLVNDISNSQPFIGSLDELRISAINRPTSWILTEYNNQKNPGNIGAGDFLTFGAEVSGGFTESLSDTVTLSDASGLVLGFSPAAKTDAVALTDASVIGTGNLFSKSDTFTFGDGTAGFVPYSNEFQEFFGFGDTVDIFTNADSNPVAPTDPIVIHRGQQIWSDEQLNKWSQDAIGQIAVDVNCIWARECIPITRGTSVYTLPAYVRTLRRVTFRGKTLDAESWEELTMLSPATVGGFIETSLSRPLYYAMHPTNPWDIRLYPTPSESFTVAGEPNPYAPTYNSPSCIIDYYREPELTDSTSPISLPRYITRRTQKAYVLWKAFAAEGKGQNLKASQFYKSKYDFLIDKFRSINEGCFVAKRYQLEDGTLSIDAYRYPRPILPTQFERERF